MLILALIAGLVVGSIGGAIFMDVLQAHYKRSAAPPRALVRPVVPSTLPPPVVSNRRAETEVLCRRFVTLNHTAVLGSVNTVGCEDEPYSLVHCYVYDPISHAILQHIRCFPSLNACELQYEPTTPCAL